MNKHEHITLYTYHNNANTKKLRKHFDSNNYNYEIRNIQSSPLELDEFNYLLSKTENGVEDILATGSSIYKELCAKGVDFESITLSELHSLICVHFKLLKVPTMIQGNRFKTGVRGFGL